MKNRFAITVAGGLLGAAALLASLILTRAPKGVLAMKLAAFTGVSARWSKPQCPASAAAVGAAAQRLIASDNARDLAGVLAGYTDDVIWLPPGGKVLQGKAAIRPRYEALFAGFKPNLVSEVVEARAEGGLGYAWGFTTGALTPLSTGAPVTVNDKFIALTRCEAGVWRVSHLMWSPRSL